MNMISITIYKAEIIEVKSIPFDDRLFDELRVNSYPWLLSGLTKSYSIEYVADHYAYNTVDILLKTESVSTALLGTLEVYDKIMNDGTSEHHRIKNL